MRTLHRYVLKNFVVTFVMAMAVLSFVMMIGLLFRSMRYLYHPLEPADFAIALFRMLPGTLSYSVPVATLVSALLVFSRLSSDSEISAMRSCGVPLSRIMRTPVLLSALLALVCVHVNNNVAPRSSEIRADLRHRFNSVSELTELLQPRQWIPISRQDKLYVGEIDGETLRDVRISQPLANGRVREIRAATAVPGTNESGDPILIMTDGAIQPTSEQNPGMTSFTEWQAPLKGLMERFDKKFEQEAERAASHRRRTKDKYTWELVRDVIVAADHPPPPKSRREKNLSIARAEIANRVTLAFACLCFALVGIPLGIQNHRRQSSAGLAIALCVAGAFYFFCITSMSLSKHPGNHAEWLAVVPVAGCLVLSAVLTRRND